MLTLRFITDPGHAWLEIDRASVVAAGVHPSSFSYHNPVTDLYYLEEDMDAPAYLDSLAEPPNLEDVYTARQSFVRCLPRIEDPEYASPFGGN